MNTWIRNVCGAVILITLGLCLWHPSAAAASDFIADHSLIYEIDGSGQTTVRDTVTITNMQGSYYPRQFTITVSSETISNVTAYDEKESLTPVIVSRNGKTTITVPVKIHPVGLGKKTSFSLRYMDGSIAKKIGKIWEVKIPSPGSDEAIGQYTVRLSVSPEIGKLAYSSPKSENETMLLWSIGSIPAGGISLAFGSSQLFTARLNYHLENPSAQPAYGDIVLPPDTSYQDVTVTSLTPEPATVSKDADGNSIARYRLAPGDSVDIEAVFRISVSAIPAQKKKDQWSDNPELTAPKKYWESDDPLISELAHAMKTPKDIYDFVTKMITYDTNVVDTRPRIGAKGMITSVNHVGVCREFTDTFIALARAAGIPSREVIGFALSDNQRLRPVLEGGDILHAWPEYYDKDKKLWVAVDPTWGKTTGGVDYFSAMDFRHVSLAIHGTNSDAPNPPLPRVGTGQAIRISLADTESTDVIPQNLTVRYDLPPSVKAGGKLIGTVYIENKSGRSAQDIEIRIDSGEPHPMTITKRVAELLPYEQVKIPITIPIKGLFDNRSVHLRTIVNGIPTETHVTVQPLFWLIIPAMSACIAGAMLWILTKKHD